MIFLLEVLERFDERRAVIRYYLQYCAPATQNVFKNPFTEGYRGLRAKFAKFDVVSERTATLDDVFESV
jgi:hypothetical protein